ncbi:MAG: hypothetical protein QNJ73_10365 [Gammaproteobacteria bacterium]|nr:hypothetical protein [Gammaproteobacteria bacterium]
MTSRMLVVVLTSIAATAHAAEPPHRFELTPFIGYRVGGSFEDDETGESFDLDDDSSFGLVLNIRDKSFTQWEFGWSHQETAVDVGTVGGVPAKLDLDIDYFQAGGTYLWDGELARPFLVATLGAAHLSPGKGGGSSETYFAFSIGGGWKLWPTKRFGLRLEGRFFGTVIDSDSKIFCVSDPGGGQAGCLFRSSADILWQFELMAGGVVRF